MKRKTGSVLLLGVLSGWSATLFAAQPFGVNGDWDFVDLIKSSGGFNAPAGGQAPALDSNGWPLGDAQVIGMDQRRNMPWRAPDAPAVNEDLAGTYRLSFTGQATILGDTEITGAGIRVQGQRYNPSTNTTTANVVFEPGHWLMALTFLNTKRNPGDQAGTGFTNMRLIRPGYPANTTQVFTKGSLQAYQIPFSAIRFLGTDAANNYCQNLGNCFDGTQVAPVTWANRVQVTDAFQGGLPAKNSNHIESHGDAWEYMIMIANSGNHDMWINIPVNADDDYVTQLATLIKNGNQYTAGLHPGLHVYVEYGNEIWNFGFNESIINQNYANAEGISNDQHYVERTIQMGQMFAGIFGTGSLNTTVRPVALWQYTQELTFYGTLGWAEQRFGQPVKNLLWGIGEAPYYNPTDTSTVDNIFNTLWTGSDSVRRDFIGWQAVASFYGLKEVGYESGPSLVGGTGAYATRDNRMIRSEEHHFLDNWFAVGGDLVNFFALRGNVSEFGDWLLVEDFEDLNTPKARGAKAIIAAPQPPLTAGYVLPWMTAQAASIDPSQRTPDIFTNEAKPGSGLTITQGSQNVYLLRATTAGTYAISLYGHASASGAQVQVLVDDSPAGTITLPPADGPSTAVNASLAAGFHGLALTSSTSGSSVLPAGTGNIQLTLTSGGGTAAVPSAPTNFTAQVNDGSAELTWAPTSTANAYRVKRSNSSGGPYQTVTTVGGNSYQNSGLTNGQTYYYVISAINQAGEGAVSAQITVVPTPPTPPSAPGGLSAQVGGGDPQPFFGGGIAILSWSTVPDTVTYNVKRSTTSGGPYQTLSSSIAPSYTDLYISNGTTYYYVVSAVNSFGESSNSNEISATPKEEVRKAPQIYNAQTVGGNVFLAWNPDPLTTPQFGTAFNVKRSETSGGPYMTVVSLNTYNAFDYTATPGKTYYYVVTATNGAGESTNSNEVSVAAGGP